MTAELQLLSVPYDTAMRGVRMGAGPEDLLRGGLVEYLRDAGHRAFVETIELPADQPPAEIRSAFELCRSVADHVRRATSMSRLPIVLAGNCMTAVGAIAGVGCERLAVLWYDSHGDFNTPDTTIGGFLDGMALATLTGRCWRQLASSVHGFRAVAERDVLLLGTRDLDALESDLLGSSGATLLTPAEMRSDLDSALEELSARAPDAYVHIDLDVLDPSEGRVNQFAAPLGLTRSELLSSIRAIGRHFRIRAAALTAFDPSYDAERVRAAAFAIAAAVAQAASEAGARQA